MTKPRKTRPNGVARQDILNAATKLFSDKGYDGVTLREIAQKAKVHLPGIYNNFENKRMLYVACCISVFSKSTNEVALAIRDDASDEENMLAYATEMAHLNINQPVMSKLAQRQVLDNDLMLIELVMQSAMHGYYGKIIAIMDRLVGPHISRRVTFAITALCFGSVQLSAYWLFSDDDKVELSDVDELADYVLNITMPQIDWAAVRAGRARKKGRGA